MDVFTKEKRSEVMSNIRSKDTKFEVLIRKILFNKGYRFRKNVKSLQGCPDIVLKKYKTVVFVHGCFWHSHSPCPLFKWPKTRRKFWENKILGNKHRDAIAVGKLKRDGWKVVTLWECRLRRDIEHQVIRLEKIIQK